MGAASASSFLFWLGKGSAYRAPSPVVPALRPITWPPAGSVRNTRQSRSRTP
jgi:hypothetical protein